MWCILGILVSLPLLYRQLRGEASTNYTHFRLKNPSNLGRRVDGALLGNVHDSPTPSSSRDRVMERKNDKKKSPIPIFQTTTPLSSWISKRKSHSLLRKWDWLQIQQFLVTKLFVATRTKRPKSIYWPGPPLYFYEIGTINTTIIVVMSDWEWESGA